MADKLAMPDEETPLSEQQAKRISERLANKVRAGDTTSPEFKADLQKYDAFRRQQISQGKATRAGKNSALITPFLDALPQEQRALGLHISTEVAASAEDIKEHVTAEMQKWHCRPGADAGCTIFHVDHAAIRTDLERRGFTATQLLSLHKAANLKPPMCVNAAGAEVPEKTKYLLAQSLCSAAGSGQHAIQSIGDAGASSSGARSERQLLDYATLGAWIEALRHQRPFAEWEPPVHAALLEPQPPKRRRKAAAEQPAAEAAEGKQRRIELGCRASEVASTSASTAPPSEATPSESMPSSAIYGDTFDQSLETAVDANLGIGADSSSAEQPPTRRAPEAESGEANFKMLCEQRQRLIERGGRQFTEITHVFREGKCPAGFEPGDEFGVKQYVNIFTEQELRSFEDHVDDMIADDEPWLANTLDVSPPDATGDKKQKRTRTKYFFPKYTYGKDQTPKRGDCDAEPLPPGLACKRCKGAQTLVTEQCNNIPAWIYQPDGVCLASILVQRGILENEWANSAILNVYNQKGGKLLHHFDSPHLFKRPIIALSLFSGKILSFGLKGYGMQPQEVHYEVNMPRGAITIMEGYAANKVNHGVKPVAEKVASLLLRRMHPSLLGKDWCAQNTVIVNQKLLRDDDVGRSAKRFKSSDVGDVSPGASAASSGCSPRNGAGGLAPLDLGNGPVVVSGVDQH